MPRSLPRDEHLRSCDPTTASNCNSGEISAIGSRTPWSVLQTGFVAIGDITHLWTKSTSSDTRSRQAQMAPISFCAPWKKSRHLYTKVATRLDKSLLRKHWWAEIHFVINRVKVQPFPQASMTWEAEFLTSVQVNLSSSSSCLGCLCPLQDEAFSYVPFKSPAFDTLVHSSHPNFVVTSLHLVYRLLLLLFPSPWKKFLTAPYNSAVTPLWHHDYLVQPLKLSSCWLCWFRNVLFNFFSCS